MQKWHESAQSRRVKTVDMRRPESDSCAHVDTIELIAWGIRLSLPKEVSRESRHHPAAVFLAS